ncbi:MAG: flagellar protein FlgN [Anaerolineae bacterium]|nr:flagellar protein FlgN [Anaerolineae bacterium]
MSVNKQSLQDLTDSLEAILVNTFRLCESLHLITQNERQALLEAKTETLNDIVQQKEAIVAEVESNEKERQGVTAQLVQLLGLGSDVQSLSDLLAKMDGQVDVSKVSRLQQGILSLQAEIREANNGNYALAVANVQRLDAVQEYIVGLFAPPVYYRPNIKIAMNEPPTSWGNDHLA